MQGNLYSNDFETAYMATSVLLFPVLVYTGYKVYSNEDGDDKDINLPLFFFFGPADFYRSSFQISI